MGKKSKRRSNKAAATTASPGKKKGAGASSPPPAMAQYEEVDEMAIAQDEEEQDKEEDEEDGELEEEHGGKKRQATGKSASTTLEEVEETLDNLKFEDPYGDVYEEEDIIENADDDDDGNAAVGRKGTAAAIDDDDDAEEPRPWNPLSGMKEDGTKLVADETAYKMLHSLSVDWPALSFDFVKDSGGNQRTRFPHSLIIAAGTQADRADRNRLNIMKLSDLARTGDAAKTPQEMDDEILGEEYDKPDNEEEEEEEEDDDDDVDLDPVLEHYSLRHNGAVNRVRVMPQHSEVVATWSDNGSVYLYDIRNVVDTLELSSSMASSGGEGTNPQQQQQQQRRGGGGFRRDPFYTYRGHSTEGYAMDWSKTVTGRLATGDCHGNVHVWDLESAASMSESTTREWNTSSFRVTPQFGPCVAKKKKEAPSVEDIQWSPTEATVFATAECNGFLRVYDVRCSGRPMISNQIHAQTKADVNVIAWNGMVANLLASGGDDGVFSVWDLRSFQPSGGAGKAESPQPLARFNCHKTPITSLEWHPTDESMICVSDDDATFVYDLSIEEDVDEGKQAQQDMSLADVPPQLLFVHCGSEHFKEVHWHPQIPSLVMTTAYSGFSVFIPSNL